MVLAKLYFYLRRVKLNILSYIITKNSRWIKNLYLKSETLKFFLEENTCSILQNIGVGKTRELTSGVSRWNYIKKTFRVHRQPTEWEKIFLSYTSDKGLISRIYKGLWKLNTKEI